MRRDSLKIDVEDLLEQINNPTSQNNVHRDEYRLPSYLYIYILIGCLASKMLTQSFCHSFIIEIIPIPLLFFLHNSLIHPLKPNKIHNK